MANAGQPNPWFGCPDEDFVTSLMLHDFWFKFLFSGREIINLFNYIHSGVKQCILNKTAEFPPINKQMFLFTFNVNENTSLFFSERCSNFLNPNTRENTTQNSQISTIPRQDASQITRGCQICSLKKVKISELDWNMKETWIKLC